MEGVGRTVRCPVCGVEFVTTKEWHRFDTDACRMRFHSIQRKVALKMLRTESATRIGEKSNG